MKQHATATKLVFLLFSVVLIIGLTAFRQKEEGKGHSFRTVQYQGERDTTTRNKRSGDEDAKHLENLEQAMKKMDEQMKQLDVQLRHLEQNKIETELARANVDVNKIEMEVKAALSKVDFDKIEKQIQAALENVDMERLGVEIKASLKELKEEDRAKLKADMAKLKVDLERDLKHSFDAEKIRKDVKEAVEASKAEMEKARAQAKNSMEFTDALDADGLINKKKAYQVEVKAGELYIDGKKQPKQVTDKYRKFFKEENFSIINDTRTKI